MAKHLKLPLLTLCLFIASFMVFYSTTFSNAADPKVNVEITSAFISAPPAGAKTAAAFLTLTSKTEDRLLRASSLRASKVELHNMTMEDGVMQMRPLDKGIDLPADQPVILSPEGMHVMFIGITEPFKPGERIPVTFEFKNAPTQTINISVR